MAEENLNTTPSGLAGAMQGMQFVRGSMGQYEPVYATMPTTAARELPEEWGGRPTGTSRRAIRMQAEWDKQRSQQLEEMRVTQQMQMEQRRINIQERDQFIQESEYDRKLKEYEAAQDIKGQAEIESNNILDWLSGRAVDEQGNPIPKPDPKTPEFQTEFLRKIAENPLGVELNKGIVDQYMNANKTYLDAQQMTQREESVIRREERAMERQLSAEERSKERQIESEERAAERQAERDIVTQERQIDKSIRDKRQELANLSALAQGKKPNATQQKNILSAQNQLLDLRIEKASLRGLVFESEEEAEKAEPPSGSTIYIGRKPFKVP